MKLVSVSEMRSIEKAADKSGLTYAAMMENAGRGLADEINLLAFSEGDEREVLGLVGPGNNGGDTLVALAHLASDGWRTRAYLIKRAVEKDEYVDRLKKSGGEIVLFDSDANFDKLTAFVSTADVIIDGVLGTGFQLPLKPEVASVLRAVNRAMLELSWPPHVVAVDCPSGVNCDTGEAAEDAIPASITVCMAAVKKGLLCFPAFELVGELRVVDIGLDEELEPWSRIQCQVADEELVGESLPLRPADSHKGTFGTALIVAGSVNYTGAPLLAGRAAYRSGVGLVQMAIPASIHTAIAGQLAEATWILLPHELGVISDGGADVLVKNLDRATAVLIGPGFGTEDSTRQFLENLLQGKAVAKKPSARIGFTQSEIEKSVEITPQLPSLVLDADALRLIVKIEDWPKILPANSILTPHPGEMSALTGLDKDTIQADRLNTAQKFAQQWNQIVVLKGAFTVIAAPDGKTTVIPVASPALARAGTGDVLAGIIVGLRAQGLEAFDAAVAGAWIHAQAGLYAAEKVGAEASVLAGDVEQAISDVMSYF